VDWASCPIISKDAVTQASCLIRGLGILPDHLERRRLETLLDETGWKPALLIKPRDEVLRGHKPA
jgi:hypothetical protein